MLGRVAVLIAVLASAAPARAQSLLTFFGGGPNLLSSTSVDAGMSGSLAITFHGDPIAGCAAKGLCGYSGVIIWRPGAADSPGSLLIDKFRRHGRDAYNASLSFFNLGGSGTTVSTEVRHAAPGQPVGTCADASAAFSTVALPVHAGSVSLGVLDGGSSVLSTRCAGPLDADVASFIPTRALALSAVLRGHRKLDLGGSRNFMADGFAGTVRSTLVLRLGGTQSNSTKQNLPPGTKTTRTRVVSEALTLVRPTGVVTARFRGVSAPEVCLGLDSCGALGADSLQPHPITAQGELSAAGPARRPYRDFLAALGLSRRGRSAGLIVLGGVAWDRGGSVQASRTQAGGGCRDSAPLDGGSIQLTASRTFVRAGYIPVEAVRVRCPGPQLTPEDGNLAAGTVPLSRLAHRQFSIALRATRSFSDDGYTGRLSGGLSITLRRGHLTSMLFRQPTG